MKVGVFIKGNTKKQSEIHPLIEGLKSSEIELLHRTTASSTDHNTHLQYLISSNCDTIIAFGGDGTLHQCVNFIMSNQLQDKIRLAHLPAGTANDFARTIEQSSNIPAFIEKLKNGQFTKIDIGKIETNSNPNPAYFINIADAGIGGEIIHGVNNKKNKGGITYTTAIIKGLFTFKRENVQITIDEKKIETRLLSLVLANGKYFANGLNIAPNASITSGELSISLFGNITLFDYFRNINRIKKGKQLKHPEVKYLKGNRIEITSKQKDYHIEADGEYIGHTKAIISIVPSAIHLLH